MAANVELQVVPVLVVVTFVEPVLMTALRLKIVALERFVTLTQLEKPPSVSDRELGDTLIVGMIVIVPVIVKGSGACAENAGGVVLIVGCIVYVPV